MHSCTSLALCAPVVPHGTPWTPRGFAYPSLDLQGLGGGPGARHIPPGSAVASPLLGSHVTYASTSVSPPVSPVSQAGGGWMCEGSGQRDPPSGPVAVLRASPTHPHDGCSTHGCLAAPQGSAAFKVGTPALIPPQPLPPNTQRARGGDRDAGTGFVKIKPLFDWLDTRVRICDRHRCWSRGWECGCHPSEASTPWMHVVAGSPWEPHSDGTVIASQSGAGTKCGWRW